MRTTHVGRKNGGWEPRPGPCTLTARGTPPTGFGRLAAGLIRLIQVIASAELLVLHPGL